jgi:ribonuclease D
LHIGDLPASVTFEGDIAVDTEAMGLINQRDRLCLVQLSDGNGDEHLVQFLPDAYHAPNLCALLCDPARVKLFHFGRFDIAILQHYLGVTTAPIYCTKIASRLTRTFTDRHGFKDLCRDLLGQEVSKQQQSSDWGQLTLTPEQQGALRELIRGFDYDHNASCGILYHLAAFWKARRHGLIE